MALCGAAGVLAVRREQPTNDAAGVRTLILNNAKEL